MIGYSIALLSDTDGEETFELRSLSEATGVSDHTDLTEPQISERMVDGKISGDALRNTPREDDR